MKTGFQHVLTLAACSLIKEFLNPKHKIGLGAKRLVVLVPFSKQPVKALGLLHKRPKVPGTRYQEAEKRGRQGGKQQQQSLLCSPELIILQTCLHFPLMLVQGERIQSNPCDRTCYLVIQATHFTSCYISFLIWKMGLLQGLSAAHSNQPVNVICYYNRVVPYSTLHPSNHPNCSLWHTNSTGARGGFQRH